MNKFLRITCVAMGMALTLSAAAYAQPSFDAQIEVLTKLGAGQTEINAVSDHTRSTGVDCAYEINYNDTSYALLDTDGNIVRINRYAEIDRLYMQKSNDSNSDFSNADEVISYVNEQIIGSEYRLTNRYNFDDTTISLRYEKLLPSGGLDNYNTYSVYVDEKYNELVSLLKKSEPSSMANQMPSLTEGEALQKAQAVFDEVESTGDKSIELGTVKSNSTFTTNNDTLGDIRLAYIVKNQDIEVYVDALSGEIIGGDIYKSLGGAIAAPELSTAYNSLVKAKAGLEKMGYSPTTTANNQNFATKVPELLNGAKGFYSCSHGNASVISSQKDMNNPDRIFSSSNVPSGSYKFVFLDACNTGSEKTWSNAFGITDGTSSNKAFLGWYQSVGANMAYDYCVSFWNSVSSNKAVRQVALEVAESQAGEQPIRFWGNRSYNGYN